MKEGLGMNEEEMTLDELIAFHTYMCEAQKIVDVWNDEEGTDQAEENFEKYSRQTQSYDDDEK